MSHVDLVAALCPGGVPFRPVGDLARIASDRVAAGSLVMSTYVGVDNLLPNFGGRRDSDYLAGSGNAIAYRPGDVLIGNIRPYLKKVWLADRDGGASPDVVTLSLRPDAREVILPAFLYCLIASDPFIDYATQHAKGGKMPRGDKSATLNYRIPVPRIEVQREVVRILNTFRELDAGLGGELALRRSQQAYYRERLMRFPDDIVWKPMGEIGRIFRGKRFTKADYVEDGGVGCIHYGEIYTDYGTTATRTVSRIRADLAPKMRFATRGDVVLTDVGETVEDVGKALAWMGADDVAIHDHCYVFRSDLNPVFVSHYMQTARFRADKDRHIARTKVNTLLPSGLPKILLPVPPAEEQDRIVAILDAFDALINDPRSGIPAEIAARRRQFEYYRDRLLRFDEAVA